MRALPLGLALATTLIVGACTSGGVEVVAHGQTSRAVADNTFTVLDIQHTTDSVTYTVRTPDDVVRDVRYARDGVDGVFDLHGVRIAGDGVLAQSMNDARLATLDLPADPKVGYDVLRIDVPRPSVTQALDAVMPDGLDEQPYEAGCTRTSDTFIGTDGCTYGVFIDECTNGEFWGVYQKRSGCFLGLFFCDCPGAYAGGAL
jgi:hypothetical protein